MGDLHLLDLAERFIARQLQSVPRLEGTERKKKKSFPGPIHEETTTEAVDNVNAGIYQWHSISTSPTSIDQTSGWRTVDELATRSFRLPGPCDLTSK